MTQYKCNLPLVHHCTNPRSFAFAQFICKDNMKHSALIFLVIITILATTFASNSADQQNSCPTKKCNRRRKIACSKPPNGEDSCPIIKCKNKFYKSKITGKTCAKKCPLYCNDAGTKKCKGPYNKRVRHNYMFTAS